MYTRLLIYTLIFASLFNLWTMPTLASEETVSGVMLWENQVKHISLSLKKNKNANQQADLLKSFHVKIIQELNNSKEMGSPTFERKISVFNRMNALFLDNFHKENCPSLMDRWNLLYSTEEKYKFEADQIQNWVNSICR